MTKEVSSGSAATDNLLKSMMSRRSFFRAGAVGGGMALASGSLFNILKAEAATVLTEPDDVTPAAEIFTIAQTAEQLAVTLYEHGVQHAGQLGLRGRDLDYIKAAGIEEQIHQRFFASLTGVRTQPATHFSFPSGGETFEHLKLFIAAQQQLEAVFDSAFLAAVRELSHQGAHRAAQIAAQIACIEAEHRVLGRDIAADHGIETLPNPAGSGTVPTDPADNWAFEPVFVEAVPDAVDLATKAGYLSPRPGNNFEYEPINFESPVYRSIVKRIMFKEPFITLTEDND